MTAKHSTKRRLLAAAILALGLAAAVDGFAIEPYWIEATHHRIGGRVAGPLKIAHLTDVHTRGLGIRERSLLAILETEKPDLIVVTGDVLTSESSLRAARELLSLLDAPLGVYVVRGNWEVMRPIGNEREWYEQRAGVRFLLNESARVRDDVWVVGLDDPSMGSPDLDAALAGVPPGVFTIALYHAPGFFDRAAGRCDLAFAGHTHGGQVRLPFLEPLYLPRGTGSYLEGWYERDGSRMYISRGVGTTGLNVRFLCRPEVAFVTVGG